MAHVLLADDDEATRDLVKRALASEGHEVDVTEDGSEALDKLAGGGAIDVLISDVHMPGMDGIELAGQAIARVPALRVLLMSGFTEELERARSLNAARLGLITKPFTLDEIRTALRKLLS